MQQPVVELRTDWLTGRSVLVAENRALRPNDFSQGPADGDAASATGNPSDTGNHPNCPFCAGNESRTPPAVYEKLDGDGRWQVRVVPNMFAALNAPDVATIGPPAVAIEHLPPNFTGPIAGPHEVIVESGRHVAFLSALSKPELGNVLNAYAERLRHWRDDGRFRYGIVFKNQGPRAGASIAHLHSQMIALPFIPEAIAAEQRRAKEAYSQHQLCSYCEVVAKERSAKRRVVIERDGFIAFCPYVSWQPGEVWLMPIDHEPSFERIASANLDRLTGVLHDLIGRLESIVPDAAYNMIVRTAPWVAGCDDYCHWRIELLPRINSFAGLEVATGVHINPVAPERTAQLLRSR